MDFSWTDEQQLMVENIKEYCEKYFTEEQVKQYYADQNIPHEALKAWVDQGFGLLGIPEEYGGIPADQVTIGLALETVHHYSGCWVPFLNNFVTMYDTIQFGNEKLIKLAVDKYLETGEPPMSIAISEPEAGSDNMNMSTVTKKQADGTYLMNGVKTFLTQGDRFPYILVLAKDEDPSRTNKNISMWLVPLDSKGISMSHMHKIGERVLTICEAYFDDVVVTEDMRIGEPGAAFVNLMHGLEMERCYLSAQTLGCAQAAMDDAAAFASQRKTWDQPIGNYQLVQERLCRMETKLQTMRTFLYKTMWEIDNGISVRTNSALLKKYCVQSSFEVCDDAMQIMGGIGYMEDVRVSRLWLDARGSRFGGGADDIMVHIAGRQLVKQYRQD
ncbi:MAG TPA: acyl-CoA dehydrogenase family protein [Candidatus Aveggerthella excrementigallinarum]|nr:acyl-CoA dehydrogenase family protein [Candidatus Aveggerthella excrementigallinarum]